MKKLLLSLCMLAFVAITSTAFGQSTGEAPFPGAKHTYQVNGGTTGSSSFTWKILDSTGAVSTDGTVSALSGSSNTDAKVYVTWATGLTTGDVYFVEVTENLAGCVNTKSLKVVIAESTFDLAISAPATDCYDGDVTVDYSSGEPVYTHGTTTLSYTVTPTGLGASETYSFTATPTVTTGWTLGTPTITAGSASITAGVVTTTSAAPVTIEYVATKTNTNANGEADNVADFTLQVAITDGVSGLGVASKAAGDQSATTAVSRPHTSDVEALD